MTHEITPCTLCKSLSCIYNGLGLACGASERFDVVSDLLRVGPGADFYTPMCKAVDRIVAS